MFLNPDRSVGIASGHLCDLAGTYARSNPVSSIMVDDEERDGKYPRVPWKDG
jgi:hypothetical protein